MLKIITPAMELRGDPEPRIFADILLSFGRSPDNELAGFAQLAQRFMTWSNELQYLADDNTQCVDELLTLTYEVLTGHLFKNPLSCFESNWVTPEIYGQFLLHLASLIRKALAKNAKHPVFEDKLRGVQILEDLGKAVKVINEHRTAQRRPGQPNPKRISKKEEV